MSGVKKWLSRVDIVIDKHLESEELNNDLVATALMISERQLFRKIKELSGLSPNKYISHHRLNRAMQYMKRGKYRTVKQTAFAVGYRNTGYFIKLFEKEFGLKPFQVLQEAGWR